MRRDGRIHWRNLGERQREDAIALVLDAVPTEAVWITIDKDALPEHEAPTNRDQGRMPLAALMVMPRAAAAWDWLKRIEARLDQPARVMTDRQGIDNNMRIGVVLVTGQSLGSRERA